MLKSSTRVRRTRRRWLLFALVLVLAALAAAMVVRLLPTAPPAGPGNTRFAATPAEVAAARSQLDGLAVVPRPSGSGDYERSAFGDAWTDTDRNGCNQRDDVLLRDVDRSLPYRVARQGGCDHDVRAGTWVDPYTGASVTLSDAKNPKQAEQVQVDHIVPLSVAWRYGARDWTDQRRLAFANDLRELVAVAGATNQDKGGSDASGWRPERGAWCGYAVRYTAVKAAYDLPTDLREKSALADMLATCP